MSDGNFRYCILYVNDDKLRRVMDVIKRHLPEDRGTVFYPLMEYYRRGDKEVKTKPMFPGYVFLYTDLNIKEVHDLLSSNHGEINTGLRELALSSMRKSDPNILFKDDESDVFELSDVYSDEKEFLDYLREREGLLKMSSGYEEGKQHYVVMEGPLKVYEKKIKSVDKHNRKAFLEFEINGKRAQAGFNCMPKAHWFPNKDASVVKLDDGSEVDLNELKNNWMTIR